MSNEGSRTPNTHQVLVKLRPQTALGAAESRAQLRPLYERRPSPDGARAFGIDTQPRWFVAEPADGAETPWDAVHQQLAGQLGVSETEVLFAEPDIVHGVFADTNESPASAGFAAGENCDGIGQDDTHGKPVGPDFGWHLNDEFTQLRSAREAVAFADPKTRIAHLDTGYYREQATVPENICRDLERSFVEGDLDRNSAEDPDNNPLLLDNSGHGTGTLGILAGGKIGDLGGDYLGGAPHAEVLPLRIADSVVLLKTSALAQALLYATENICDVVSLSMGGVPSEAWTEAVDAAYEAGVCICAAAGNHVGPSPPKVLVYPARYPRVIAVCGVMANNQPYDNLSGLGTLQGSFGPSSVMTAAIASYTPNVPWPIFMCPTGIRHNGEGTSAATPQVAAAAALWLEKYKNELPRDWRRVEAVRNALFTTAKLTEDGEHYGKGVLQARSALEVRPQFGLSQSPRSKNSFAFLRLITGLGITEPTTRERMFDLELSQRWLVNPKLQDLVPDPDRVDLTDAKLREVMEAIIEDNGASRALRSHVASRYPVAAGRSAPRTEASKEIIPLPQPACRELPSLRNPAVRRVRVYARDPSFSTQLETARINEVILRVAWEDLTPGPSGEYLLVEDVDATGRTYEPLDLDDPRLLGQDGWAPSEGNPQFHQQMVYAVSMKTIEFFEGALGRPVLWRPEPNPDDEYDDSRFCRQLKIRPHALRQANAFYSPVDVALLFGYFEAPADDPDTYMPGSTVFSCLSHDIIAHETTHAILDGMHRRFNEATNPDVLAFHEGFADIVALMQHFTIPEVLRNEIEKTRGKLDDESMLGSLAVQFGQATGNRGALREAIGRIENGRWKRFDPDPSDLKKRLTPHSRGAILVAAVFDAFLAIFKARTADLLRIYTGGTGVLQDGAIHPDLVERLASEAAKSAEHVLTICIRAIDYLPPVDVEFFDYLRALITADFDLVAEDRLGYRVAFVEAFRRRGIYPLDIDDPDSDVPRTLSVDTLRWQGFGDWLATKTNSETLASQFDSVIDDLKDYADRCLYISDRNELFSTAREIRITLHEQLKNVFKYAPEFAQVLGLDPTNEKFEVHELRRAARTDHKGRLRPQIIVAITQDLDLEDKKGGSRFRFRGGSTLIVDLAERRFKYRIVKRMSSAARRQRAVAFQRDALDDPLKALLLAPRGDRAFAALHQLGNLED